MHESPEAVGVKLAVEELRALQIVSFCGIASSSGPTSGDSINRSAARTGTSTERLESANMSRDLSLLGADCFDRLSNAEPVKCRSGAK